MIVRLLKHLSFGKWSVYSKFSKTAFKNIEETIRKSEMLHRGEIRFAVESSLSPLLVFRKISGRDRAIDFFTSLRIWDTEDNTGVLIYLLLADRDIEIIADRGIHKKVEQATWDEICHGMEKMFREGKFEEGVIKGINDITYYLAKYFPHNGYDNPNELPNHSVIV